MCLLRAGLGWGCRILRYRYTAARCWGIKGGVGDEGRKILGERKGLVQDRDRVVQEEVRMRWIEDRVW